MRSSSLVLPSSRRLRFLLLRHSQPTEWAPRENWNMLTFTGRRKGELRREDEKTKDVEGLNHKGCGRLDFTSVADVSSAIIELLKSEKALLVI